MRKCWIQHPETGKLIPADEYVRPTTGAAPSVIGDIKPYKSTIDGSMIGSRSHHRQHLREHGCVEVGNEKLKNPYRKDHNPDSREIKRDIARSIEELSRR